MIGVAEIAEKGSGDLLTFAGHQGKTFIVGSDGPAKPDLDEALKQCEASGRKQVGRPHYRREDPRIASFRPPNPLQLRQMRYARGVD